MPPSIESILKDSEFRPDLLQRVAFRKAQPPLAIVPSDPSWPADFEHFRSLIAAALTPKEPPSEEGTQPGGLLSVSHVGSTSIPGLPAKAVIDIDLVVPFHTDEATYVPYLEAAGFQFISREPHWHGHRFFAAYGPPRWANLHVWGPECPEVERHRIFREYLLAHADERERYVAVKEEAMRATREAGDKMQDYNWRKQEVIRGILKRAFQELGYIKDDADGK
jgi:GrpB-like predicted nucleotidyltransferase (UPF0157 family)